MGTVVSLREWKVAHDAQAACLWHACCVASARFWLCPSLETSIAWVNAYARFLRGGR